MNENKLQEQNRPLRKYEFAIYKFEIKKEFRKVHGLTSTKEEQTGPTFIELFSCSTHRAQN